MSLNFDDILNSDLPSKKNAVVTESLDDEKIEDTSNVKVDGDDDSEDGDLNDIDIEDISEEELEEIDEDDLAAIGDDDEEELTDDEATDADQTMALVATPILLDDELKEESVYESFIDEFGDIVSEGFLLEEDADDYIQESSDIMTEKAFAAKTRVQLNEADRRKQLFEVGVQASGRAHNDPIYWKLQKVYKLERLYKAKLRQKYRGEALKRVKAYIKKLKSSKSKILSGLAEKLTKKA